MVCQGGSWGLPWDQPPTPWQLWITLEGGRRCRMTIAKCVGIPTPDLARLPSSNSSISWTTAQNFADCQFWTGWQHSVSQPEKVQQILLTHNRYSRHRLYMKNIPFEVGSRGHLTLENKSILTIIHKLCKTKTSFKRFCQNISKTSLLCSYAIYLSKEDTWNNSTLLTPVKQWMWT